MKLDWLSALSEAELVGELGRPHVAPSAARVLAARGRGAAPAVLAGLNNERADVRLHCCRLLDRIYEEVDFAALLAMVSDADARVRSSALHTLSCDRCKEDEAPDPTGPLLERALEVLAADPNPHVRAMAVEAVGRAVHVSPRARAALETAASDDASPAVRKKARWFAPGGPVHRRTAPKSASVV